MNACYWCHAAASLAFVLEIATGVHGAEKPKLERGWAEGLLDRREVNLGAVPPGLDCVIVVSITNRLQTPIRIHRVRDSTAGIRCTQPAKKFLQPGESTSFEVRPDTRRYRGKKETHVPIEFDQPEWAEVAIRISWDARTDIVVNPGRFAFDTAKYREVVSKTVSIRHVGAADWKINAASCDDKSFEVSVRETSREKKGDGTTDVISDVTVARRADAPAGKVDTRVLVELDDPKQKSFEILLQGEFGNTTVKHGCGPMPAEANRPLP
jgi:hypothetical protein